MPLLYTVKHVSRSWKLFSALLIGIMLASTFFAGIDLKANATAKQAFDQQLSTVYVDMEINSVQLNSTDLVKAQEIIASIEGVNATEISARAWLTVNSSSENEAASNYAQVVGIADNSQVWEGWLNKPAGGIGENETYILTNSPLANNVTIGDTLQINFTTFVPVGTGNTTSFQLDLTVKGVAQLDKKAYAIATGNAGGTTVFFSAGSSSNLPQFFAPNYLLVSWEKTVQKAENATPNVAFSPSLLVYVNRDKLLSAWDAQTSISNVERISRNIENKMSVDFGQQVYVQDYLQGSLQFFQYSFAAIMFEFIIISLPIFFIAWYLGTTVNDVSYNLRRREIGLLSTKGFSKGQIQRMFMTETLVIGLLGGLLGVLAAFLLIPVFTGNIANAAFDTRTINYTTVVVTVGFALLLAFFSTYSSAKKAAQLPTVDALREYLPGVAERPYRKRLTWLAFILGTYKIVVFASGLNVVTLLNRVTFSSGNFILILLAQVFVALDTALNYIGPLLFFYGFTKLFIQGSLKFQELTARAAKFMGDLNVLATKNVRRNPARAAAIAFLIALIVGYSVQVTGQLASEQDYTRRQVYANVGADIAANIANVTDAQNVTQRILANISGQFKNATVEYTIYGGNGMTIKAVEPQSWLAAAYYEDGWFSGASVKTAFNDLALNNDSIILERKIAKSSGLNIGETISVTIGTKSKNLKIVGFFGPEPPDSSSTTMPLWSFVPVGFDNETASLASSARLLLALGDSVNGTNVAETIRHQTLLVSSVDSFAEDWENSQANPQTNAITMGALDVQRLGVLFAFLAASVGTALVSIVSMKERSREAALMSAKGMSYRQLVLMFLTENFAIVIFAVVIGLIVGWMTVNGLIASANAAALELVTRRLIFPADSAIMLTSCMALIFASAILPIMVMARLYVSKLERMVRLR
jgi:putative ABC transport system permease protein